MNSKIRSFFLIISIGFVINACNCQDEVAPGEKVEIYLLESFETFDDDPQIDENTAVLAQEPLVPYSDLVSYNPANYTYRLSEHGKESIIDDDLSIHGKAFAVVVDGDIIYTGYFWASFSSSICQWVIADPIVVDMSNELEIRLGYPGKIDGVEIPDRRNDPLIISTFKNDGKLIN